MAKQLAAQVAIDVALGSALFYYVYKENQELKKEIEELREQIKAIAVHTNGVHRDIQMAFNDVYRRLGVTAPLIQKKEQEKPPPKAQKKVEKESPKERKESPQERKEKKTSPKRKITRKIAINKLPDSPVPSSSSEKRSPVSPKRMIRKTSPGSSPRNPPTRASNTKTPKKAGAGLSIAEKARLMREKREKREGTRLNSKG